MTRKFQRPAVLGHRARNIAQRAIWNQWGTPLHNLGLMRWVQKIPPHMDGAASGEQQVNY